MIVKMFFVEYTCCSEFGDLYQFDNNKTPEKVEIEGGLIFYCVLFQKTQNLDVNVLVLRG